MLKPSRLLSNDQESDQLGFFCLAFLLLFTYNEYTIQKQHRVSQEGMNRESLSHLS